MLTEQALSDRRFAKSTVDVRLGGISEAHDFLARNSTPDVIIVESGDEKENLLAGIDMLSEVCDPGTSVIVLGDKNDVALYRALVHRGVNDYLARPLTAPLVQDAVLEVCRDAEEQGMGRVLAFLGAKGGVGSSTLAGNVAWSLGQLFDEDVALLDLDIAFGTVALSFNLESQQNIDKILAERDRLDETLLERVMPSYDGHLNLLTAPASLQADAEVDFDSLGVLLELVQRRAAFVVLDLPHGWRPWIREILAVADEVVVTATLDLASLRDTKNLIDTLRQLRGDTDQVRVVLNRAGGNKKNELKPRDFEAAIGGQPTAVLANDPNLFGAAENSADMLGEVNKNAKPVAMISQLAETVSGRTVAKKKKSLFSFAFKSKG
jgi:pilus assembly protein CpaE